MPKIFNPKITQGRWACTQARFEGIYVSFLVKNEFVSPHDSIVISAIPEMLEVVKAVNDYLDTEDAFNDHNLMDKIKNSYENLVQIHGMEV